VLDQLAVRNRDNMFVFRETSNARNVFYLRLHSSIESMHEHDRIIDNDRSLTSDEIRTTNSAHILLFTVHGIDAPTDEICVQMRAQLQRRLDAAVLDELIATLRRYTYLSTVGT